MTFIFPQNYKFKNKLFGIIDYSVLLLNIVWCSTIFCFLNLFINSFNIKLFIFIIFCFPLLLFSIIGFNNENIIYVFYYVSKFMNNRKIILYKKTLS